jgi:hypothetical protein
MKNKKQSKNTLKRTSFDDMIKINKEDVTFEDVTIYVFAKNRNPEQVPDSLWEEILEAHVEQGRYN